MTYLTLGNGWINKSQFADEGSNRPGYYGSITIDEEISENDTVDVALWKKEDGSFSIKLSKRNS